MAQSKKTPTPWSNENVPFDDHVERTRTHKGLWERRDFAEGLIEAMHEGVSIIDPKGIHISVNQALCDITGFSRDELIGSGPPHPYWPEEEYEAIYRAYKAMHDGQHKDVELIFKRKDGTRFPVVVGPSCLTNEAGELICYFATIKDVTEDKRSERQLREEHAFRTAVINRAAEGLCVCHEIDTEPFVQFTVWNNRMTELTGYTMAEINRLGWYQSLYPDPAYRQKAIDRMARMRGGDDIQAEEWHITRADGVQRTVSISTTVLQSNSGDTHVLALMQDITDRKLLERERIRTQRLRAVGELSAGVSHNLNNILTGILGPAQLLRTKTDDPEMRRDIDIIIQAAERASNLVHRLHLSTRGVAEETLGPVDVGKVIQEAIYTSQPRWKDEREAQGAKIQIDTHLDEALLPIKGTESQLHDVFLNLIFNAVDAMPQGGHIHIGARAKQEMVEIEVSDTGHGMDETTRQRIFEPFFTTKMDVGSGLGLSTVYGTLSRWGGAIEVRSTPGSGTTFSLCLPIWKGPVFDVEERKQTIPSRSGRLLIVDDDPLVRRFLHSLLNKEHDVHMVENGEQALKEYAQGKFDVILIDLGMPGISGDQLVKQLQQVDPPVVTVLITGWEINSSDPRSALFDFVLKKPFVDISDISTVINEALHLHDQRQ